ncbi:MAG: hypothetical protein N2044_12920 [Cyclobacteriaceae bacterium]|nr:hypothetical protein [Cyclobacteriaceae bacterium]
MPRITLHNSPSLRCTVLLFTLAFSTAVAQESGLIGLYGNINLPYKEFREAVDNPIGGTAVGFDLQLLFNPKGKQSYSPVYPGIDFTYVTFGRDFIDGTPTTPPLKTTFNYYAINALFRLMPVQKQKGFIPFIDGALGLEIYNTRTKIDKNALDIVLNDSQPEVIHTTNDTGLVRTLAIGWFIRRPSKANPNQPGGSFTLRIGYSYGSPIDYVKRGSVAVDNGFVTYEEGRTRAQMILIQLGLNLPFTSVE